MKELIKNLDQKNSVKSQGFHRLTKVFARFVQQIKKQNLHPTTTIKKKLKKMLEFYPNLNINSGMIQEQSESILKTSCGRTGNKKELNPSFSYF